MSRLSEQHMSKTKSTKLLSVPTRVCSTVESPAQYQLSRATVQPTKACQSSSTVVSHQGQITSLYTCRDSSRRRVRTHLLQILHNKSFCYYQYFKVIFFSSRYDFLLQKTQKGKYILRCQNIRMRQICVFAGH